MSAVPFDTHFFVKKLTKTGIPEIQAEVIVEFINELRKVDLNSAANKASIQSLNYDLHELEFRLKNQFHSLQSRIGSMFITLGGILIAIKYFG